MPADKKTKPELNIEEWALPDHSWDDDLDTPVAPKPASKPEEKPDAPPVPSKQSHSAHLAASALEVGLTQEEIDQTPSESLQQTVRHLYRKIQEDNSRERRLAPAATTAPAAPVPEKDDLDELGELKDDLDPRYAAFLRRLVRENRELKEQVGQVRGHIQQKATETRDQWIDRLFDEQGDADKFGRKSDGKGLTQDQLRRRPKPRHG